MKKKTKFICILILAIVGFTTFVFFFIKDNENEYISMNMAAKRITLLEESKNNLIFNGNDNWESKYINYMQNMGYIRNSHDFFTYGDLKNYIKANNIDIREMENATGITIRKQKKNTKITKSNFNQIYDYLILILESKVERKELIVVNQSSWQINTNVGTFTGEGLDLRRYVDKKILVYVRDSEILDICMLVSEKITYENVYMEKASNKELVLYIGGQKKKYELGGITTEFDNQVGDVCIENGIVTLVKIKQEKIRDKVLMIDEDKVELEGYGVIPIASNFHVYKTFGMIEEGQLSDVLVGYSITEFVVSGKEICGAIINETLIANNIRVMIMSTGFTSVFHKRVSLHGTGDYIIKYGDIEEIHKATEIVDFYSGVNYLNYGRITIEPLNKEDKIEILNVEKSYGTPKYYGKIEISEYEEGLVIINDVEIEKYLCAVVPSEMPSRFGVEALKVQAVCARSYAYKQLQNNTYSKYGAHVDDSVNFQVYNNVEEKDVSIQAVKETRGQVLSYNNAPVTAYYYSTSCGMTSDISVWCANSEDIPYLKSKRVNNNMESMDLSNEQSFENYINSVNENDFDYGFGYYRWAVAMTIKDLTESINENLYGRYCSNPGNILVKNGENYISKEIRNIGELQEIKIVKRTKSGALSEIILVGSEAEILVKNELNIRYLLSPRNNPITLLMGDTTTFYILPSAFCFFEKTENGYLIRGGGYGHGIGMSQNAVSKMVIAGMKYDEILKFFFEGTDITNVYE